MHYNTLGSSSLKVSCIGLGTMTFGEQNTQQDAFAQLNYAIEQGINFIDTAEMYAIPPKAETYGATETIIGEWLAKTGFRDRVILASKVIGRAEWLPHIRNGQARLDRKNIETAIHGSLKRLQTDYLDLYQIHWPDRKTNFFGQRSYPYTSEASPTEINETLSVLGDLVQAGKVRYLGISNETPWGLMQYLKAAQELNLPRIISIQNPYNLLNRSFEAGLTECCYYENIHLLAYSPLAFGVLSGKYLQGTPEGARLSLFPNYRRYSSENAVQATRAYVELARQHGLTPVQMALAFINSRPFLGSNLIGATTLAQLQENIASIHVSLSDEVLKGIEAIQNSYPNPCP